VGVRLRTFWVGLAILVGVAGQYSTPAFAAGQMIKLNDGFEAEILSLGRDKSRQNISLSMRLTNAGADIAYLALTFDPPPAANTNTGGHYVIANGSIAGIAKCANVSSAQCMGLDGERFALPLQSWTKLSGGTGTVINLSLYGPANAGPLISFSASLVYFLVSDKMKDDTLSDSQKRQRARTMALSFAPLGVVDEP
jgi:hypothetical protein